MSNTTELGDIAIPVGWYEKNGEKKKRYRRVGTLMQTERDDGQGFWIKLNVDALSPSLYVAARCCLAAGDDQAILSVFEREEKKTSTESAPADPDL